MGWTFVVNLDGDPRKRQLCISFMTLISNSENYTLMKHTTCRF